MLENSTSFFMSHLYEEYSYDRFSLLVVLTKLQTNVSMISSNKIKKVT